MKQKTQKHDNLMHLSKIMINVGSKIMYTLEQDR